MKVCMVQFQPSWLDPRKNFTALMNRSSELPDDCDLIIFPEMCTSGFAMNPEIFTPEIQDEADAVFSHLACETASAVIAGTVESTGGHFFNSAVFLDAEGKQRGIYRKIHPFSFVHEQEYFSPGPAGGEIFGHKHMRITPGICYDLRFPEMFRVSARQTNLIVIIANWPTSRIGHWKTLITARAVENQCFVAAVNRLGSDGNGVEYPGESMIAAPDGRTVRLNGNPLEDEVLSAEIDLGEVETIRQKFQFLPDMRHRIELT
ncbi:nitrilase-related carbon-nitrogen hydrolase [Salinispira pacifica]|nr:nitrilase-related carbon-nitrogen hydrolase [Salinispira pacifica]